MDPMFSRVSRLRIWAVSYLTHACTVSRYVQFGTSITLAMIFNEWESKNESCFRGRNAKKQDTIKLSECLLALR